MNSFKQAAISILKKVNKPLHYKELTKQAIDQGILKTEGKTPWASMNAQIAMDIKVNGDNSLFYRSIPGHYGIKDRDRILSEAVRKAKKKMTPNKPKTIPLEGFKITPSLNSKQKGDITEARVAELITLYGDEGLSCYKPISDDEGIDLIVKRRGKLEVVYIQVKSAYGNGQDRGFVCGVKGKTIKNKQKMLMVFVYFDLSQGDVLDQIFCVPAPDFIRLSENKKKTTDTRMFTVGLNSIDKSKWSEFMIEKRELANKIVEIMDKL